MFRIILLPLLLLMACTKGPERAPAIGEAFAGPATLAMREEIAPRSRVLASVPHGERLEIVQQRRRFYKVRGPQGIEGWVDERMLLGAQEISNLRRLAEDSKSRPSQAVATTFDDLNVHTEPYRLSPSFLQVKQGQKVDVIGRANTPRATPARKFLVKPGASARLRKKRDKKQKAQEPEQPPPPLPAAPKPPEDWLALSKPRLPAAAGADAEKSEPASEPMDDWTLVRTATGQTGWVLTRRLYMNIPDEVAQYAEGARIAAYFPVGETRQRDKVRTTWLWATVVRALQPYDFDSIRVFTWSTRRERYETSFIERNLTGFYPILLHPVDEPAAFRGKGQGGKLPGFSILVMKKDGSLVRRRYAMWDTRVRSAGEVSARNEPLWTPPGIRGPLIVSQASLPATPSPSLWARLLKQFAGLRERFSR